MLACFSDLWQHTFLLIKMRQQLSLQLLRLESCLSAGGMKLGVPVRGLLAPIGQKEDHSWDCAAFSSLNLPWGLWHDSHLQP